MATNFSPRGSSNSTGNALNMQLDVPGGQAGGTNYTDIWNALDRAEELIVKDRVEKKLIEEVFPGYLQDQFQTNIVSSGYSYVYAETGWKDQKYMTFTISPGRGKRYNPANIRLSFKAKIVTVKDKDNEPLDNNAIPVENFYQKLFKKVEINNIVNGELVNKSIEYDTGLFNLMSHFYYDKEDYKHTEEERNQNLVNSMGRRLLQNATNLRLDARLGSTEYEIWKNKEWFHIDLSKIHTFFSINELMYLPIEIKLYLNDDFRQLFEIKPAAAVANPYETLIKVEYDSSYPPTLLVSDFDMSVSYQQQDKELYKKNRLYDLGNYTKPYKTITTVPLGADRATLDITGVTERPEWLIIQLQSLTSQEHQTHYDSYSEDQALNLIKRVFITGIGTVEGLKEIDFEVNNDSKLTDQLYSYNALRRFTTNAPLFATSTALKGVNYLKNFPTEVDYRACIANPANGCFPLVFDLSDSKGNYNGSIDNTSFISSKMQCTIQLNTAAVRQSNFVATVVTTAKYGIKDDDNGRAYIFKT